MERTNGGDKGDHGMVHGFKFSVFRVIWFQYLALLCFSRGTRLSFGGGDVRTLGVMRSCEGRCIGGSDGHVMAK